MARSGGKPVANRKIVGRCEHAFIAKSLVMACGPERSRTADLTRARGALYQLSYWPRGSILAPARLPLASLPTGSTFAGDELEEAFDILPSVHRLADSVAFSERLSGTVAGLSQPSPYAR